MANSEQRLSITYLPISALKPDPKNPRQHNDRQIRLLAKSMETMGFNVPILVDADLNIIAGHGRLLACHKLKWKEAPTIRLDHLTDAQARAFMIADNRLTEIAEWDDMLLAESLKSLSELNLDFSLEVTGFTMGEIDLRIEGLEENKEDVADILPPEAEGSPITQPADLWVLGHHRIYCGSALETSTYSALMNGKQASVIFTDPPYNVPIDGNVSGLGVIKHREFAMASGEMSKTEFTEFLKSICTLLAQHSINGSIHYICMDWRHMGELLAAGESVYTELKNLCVWAKDNAGMGSFYRSQHELVFVFKNGKSPHRNNIQLGQYGRHRSNVWK